LNKEKLWEVRVGWSMNIVAIILTEIFQIKVFQHGLMTARNDHPTIKVMIKMRGISPVSAILKN